MPPIKPGDAVVLMGLPPGFCDNLPVQDQQALSKVIGRSVRFKRYDETGRCELEFTDAADVIHVIYVAPEFIKK